MVSFSALASADLASRATNQLSRSAALEAWKVCFWPATLKRNSLEPSLVRSVTSAWNTKLAVVLLKPLCHLQTRTRLKMLAGVALSSARLVRKNRPLPVWVAQAVVALATAGFSFWR